MQQTQPETLAQVIELQYVGSCSVKGEKMAAHKMQGGKASEVTGSMIITMNTMKLCFVDSTLSARKC
jgi:hypothetical protein